MMGRIAQELVQVNLSPNNREAYTLIPLNIRRDGVGGRVSDGDDVRH